MLLVSDIHFGANRDEDISSFLTDALDPVINPDKRVIIAGDITQNASESEFQQAADFLSYMMENGIKLLFTPGNHDFGDWIGEVIMTDRKARSRCRQLMVPILQQPEVAAHHEFDSIVRCDDHVFVVLRSTHRGESHKLGLFGNNRITGRQIEWARTSLDAMKLEGRSLHLVTHRSLWQESGDMHTNMVKISRLEDQLLSCYPFATYIHGHNHRYVFADTTTPRRAIPIRRLGLPTLSTRNRHWQRGYVSWNLPYKEPPRLLPSMDLP